MGLHKFFKKSTAEQQTSREASTSEYLRYLFPNRHRLLGATSLAEQAYCEWLTSEQFTGKGCIVEFGPWLGSLTAPLAVGLIRNLRTPRKTIHSYDLFRWETGSNGWAAGTPFDKLYQPGDCFKPLYEQLMAPLQGDVTIHANQADLSVIGWSGEPIEILINDAWKTLPVMANTVQKFFPSLLEGAIVFHQDFLWCTESFIHVGMYRLREHFDFIERVQNSSTSVFRMTSRPSKRLIAGFETLTGYSGLCEAEIDAAFDWSLSLFSDPEARLVLKAGKAWLLHKIGHDDKARRLFAENKASTHYGHPYYQFQEKILIEWGYGHLIL